MHAADIEGEIDKVLEARGIKALFSGLRLVTKDDYETLELGFRIWDAIYAYYKLRDLEEKHREELASMSRSERLRYLKKLLKE